MCNNLLIKKYHNSISTFQNGIRIFAGRSIVVSALVASFMLFALVGIHAEEKESPFQIVTNAKGVGVVIGGDFVTAEKVAIVNAKIAAIEKAVGVQIESGTVVIDSALADSWMEKFSSGVVSDYSLRDEKRDKNKGVVSVWIDAVVKKALLPKDGVKWWEEMKSNFTVIVLLDENWQPEEGAAMKPVDVKTVQPYLEGVLSRNNYTVLSEGSVKKLLSRKQLLGTVTVRELIAEMTGLDILANLSIGGDINSRFSSRGNDLTWYHSEYNIGLVNADTAQVLNSFADWTKGAGSLNTQELSNRQAYENSVENARDEIAERVLESLDKMIGEDFNREVIVEVRGLPDFKRYQWFVDILKNTDWVELPKESIDKRFFNTEFSEITIMYKEKSYFLAYKLDNNPTLEVLETGYNKIVVRYNSSGK
jgi:hypothetical protein